MVSLAQNKSLCIEPPALTAWDFQISAVLAQRVTERHREMLQAAKQRCQRQLAWNQRSMTFGLFLGVAAVAVLCYRGNLAAYWPSWLAAAVELGFVPCYTAVQSRRLRHRIDLIDRDLEEGLVRDGIGRVRMLFGVWPVVEDCTTRSLRLLAGRVAFAGLRPGARVIYRFAARSRLVLSMRPEEPTRTISERSDLVGVQKEPGRDACDDSRIDLRMPRSTARIEQGRRLPSNARLRGQELAEFHRIARI
jgi:hypothetical protein